MDQFVSLSSPLTSRRLFRPHRLGVGGALLLIFVLLVAAPGSLAQGETSSRDASTAAESNTLEPVEPGIITGPGGPTGGFDCVLDDGTFCNGEFQNGCVYTTTCPRAKMDQCIPYPLCSEVTAL